MKDNKKGFKEFFKDIFSNEKKRTLFIAIIAFMVIAIVVTITLCCVLIPEENKIAGKTVKIFYYDGEELLEESTATEGKDLEFYTPSKTGYAFVGWYLKDQNNTAFTREFLSTYSYDADLLVYARWDMIDPIKITYVTNGGDAIAPSYTPRVVPVNLPDDPKFDGHHFLFWCLDATLTTPYYSGTILNTNTTLYAKWVPNDVEGATATITLSQNDGTDATQTLTASLGGVLTLPTPERTGYIFKGWYADKDFQFLVPVDMIYVQDITLYAKWVREDKIVSLNLDCRGGTLATSDVFEYQAGDKIITANLPRPTKSGDVFLGWCTDSSLTVAVPETVIIGNDLIFYAKYQSDLGHLTCTVTYHGYGSAPISYTYREGEIITQPASPPEKDGNYFFDGWYEDEELTTPFEFGVAITKNIVLYPKWSVANNAGLVYQLVEGGFEVVEVENPYVDTITIPDTFADKPVVAISERLLYNNIYVKTLVIGANVQKIGEYAFSGLQITNLLLPESVVSIEEGAFERCTYLETLTIKGKAVIGNSAFEGCRSLTLAILGDAVSVGDRCFASCKLLKEVGINRISYLGEYAFEGCEDLSSINMNGATIREIRTGTFQNCYDLQSIYFPTTVERVMIGAFDASGLKTVNTSNIRDMGEGFANCYGLEKITLSKNISQNVNFYLEFKNCTSLKTVLIDGENPYYYLENNAVYSADKKTLYALLGQATDYVLPASVNNVDIKAFFLARKLKNIQVASGNTTYKAVGGHLYSADGKTMIAFAQGQNLVEFTTIAGVTTIQSGCFYGGTLEKIIFSDDVKLISMGAMYEMNKLQNISYKSGTTLEEEAVMDTEGVTYTER